MPEVELAFLHVARLAGSVAALLGRARATDDPQWRLEPCDHPVALGEPAEPPKADAMKRIAEEEVNATVRDAYLGGEAAARGG